MGNTRNPPHGKPTVDPTSIRTRKGEIPPDLPDDPEASYRGETLPHPLAAGGGSGETLDTLTGLPLSGPERQALAEQAMQAALQPVDTAQLSAKELLGRGGGGDVWLAEQRSLGRLVAMKVPRVPMGDHGSSSSAGAAGSGGSAHDGITRRCQIIEHEAIAGAVLEHPNIVPVYDLCYGPDERPRLVMRRVRGSAWRELLEAEIDRLPLEDYLSRHLPILTALAQAVAYAHSRAIIHRDIKPSQVMVGEYGEVMLMDWGLAAVLDPAKLEGKWKPEECPLSPTIDCAGNPAGTPAFMAPEQTLPHPMHLGPWTDVYLLGATLFCVLTGLPPHQGTNVSEVYMQAMEGARPYLDEAQQRRGIPAELCRLAEEAMTPDYSERDLTAREFLQRLQDFQSGYSLRRESQEKTNALLTAMDPMPRDYEELTALLREVDAAGRLWPQNPALHPLREALHGAYAQRALELGDLALARLEASRLENREKQRLLASEATALEQRALRREAQRRFAFLAVAVLALLCGVAAMLAFTQRGEAVHQRHLADQRLVEVSDAMELVKQSEQDAAAARDAAQREYYFSGIQAADAFIDEARPEKAREVLLGVPDSMRNWEWGRLMAVLNADELTYMRGATTQGSAIFHGDFTPDGSTLITGHAAGAIRRWNARSGALESTFVVPCRGAWSVDASPDGDRLLVASLDGKAFIVDAQNGTIEYEFAIETKYPVLRGAAWSPDGRLVAVTGTHDHVEIHDVEGRQRLHVWPLSTTDGGYAVEFTADGSALLVALLHPGGAALLDWRTGEERLRLPELDSNTLAARLNPQEDRIVTASMDGRVRLYDVAAGELLFDALTEHATPRYATFALDGQVFAASDSEGVIRIWDSETFELLALQKGAKQMEKLAVSPDGTRFVSISFDEAKQWNLEELLPITQEVPIPQPSTLASWQRIVLPGYPNTGNWSWYDRDVHYSAAPGQHRALRTSRGPYLVTSLYHALSADGRWAVTVSPPGGGQAILRDRHGELPDRTIHGPSDSFHAVFHPDGQRFALVRLNGAVEFWDALAGEMTGTFPETGSGVGRTVWRVAFSPDGKSLAGGTFRGHLKRWDVETRKLVWTADKIHATDKAIVALAWSPDGTRIATGSTDETASIVDASTGQRVAKATGHRLNVISVDFSPDGTRLLTVSMDNSAKLWDATTGRELITLLPTRRDRVLLGGAFSQNGQLATIVQTDGTLNELPALPHVQEAFPLEETASLQQAIELWKRRQTLGPGIEASEIAWK